MLNLRKSSPNPGVLSSSTSQAGELADVYGVVAGLATVEGRCELPLEVVSVDVIVVVRSIWAAAVPRSSILALIRLSVRLLCVSGRFIASSVARDGVWGTMYELGEGTNVALAKSAAVETEGSTIAIIDGLLCFFLLRRDLGRRALD
jgi:hypothetical protein